MNPRGPPPRGLPYGPPPGDSIFAGNNMNALRQQLQASQNQNEAARVEAFRAGQARGDVAPQRARHGTPPRQRPPPARPHMATGGWIPFSHIGPAKPTTMTLDEFRNFRNAGGYAKGGTVQTGPTLRRPYNHRMIGMTSFEHGKIKPGQVGFIDDSSPKFAQASFYQGGYFVRADHQLI